jgi:hypothetical protein
MHLNHTLVIGAGGSGGQLIPSLARLLAYHPNANASLTIADGDAFEEHNQTRQLCGPDQLGRNKAEAMAELCAAQGLDFIRPCPRFLDANGLRQQLKPAGCLLVVSTVDNDATRLAVIEALAERQDNWLHVTTGNADDSDGQQRINSSTHWHGLIDGEAVGLNPALLYPNIAEPSDVIPRQGSCALAAPSSPQLISANALAATMALLVVQNALDGRLDPTCNSAFANGRTFKLSFS